MALPAVGVLSVRCPVCRHDPGRPCTNRRGYLLDGMGSHPAREAAWAAAERDEAYLLTQASGSAEAPPQPVAG